MKHSGVYEFGSIDMEACEDCRTIELAPNIFAVVVRERVSLCRTSRKQTHSCFWEGDCEVELDIDGQTVIINDHDEKKDKRNYFVYNRRIYYVVGHLFQIDSDEVIRLRYTVCEHTNR